MNRIWGFLFLSFALHIFSGTVATVVAPYFAKPFHARQDSTVDLLETTPKKKTEDERNAQLFAGKVQIPESMKIKKEAKHQFFSDEDVTVLEQTRAKDTGRNANRMDNGSRISGNDFDSGKPGIKSGQNGKSEHWATEELKKFGHGEVSINNVAKDGPELKPLTLPNVGGQVFERGTSEFAYSAPDIKIGKITALNTDRFVYFGFYQRTDERIYPQWENFVRAAIYTYQNTHRVFGSKQFMARYEVLLQPDGTYQKAILRESSGLSGIDLALAQAFRKATQIPHPPSEMVQADGLIHLNYGVTVEIGPGQIADAE